MVSRRAVLSATALALAATVRAAPAAAVHRVGILAQDLQPGLLDAFQAGLHDYGYDEGRNITIDLRNAEGHNDRLPGMMAELLQRGADVVLAVNTPAALAVKKATDSVPIVIMRVADPVKSGLVASIARPGGNVTGLLFMLDEFGAKGLELLRELIPRVSRIGILFTADNPGLLSVAAATERRGALLQLEFVRLPVGSSSDIAAAFQTTATANIDGLFVIDDGAMTARRHEILDLAKQRSLPVVSIYRDFAAAGGLIAYGPNLGVFYRRAAYYVDRILKGTAPRDLPVEQPTKYDLVINLKTAKALGLTVSPEVLLRADETIE